MTSRRKHSNHSDHETDAASTGGYPRPEQHLGVERGSHCGIGGRLLGLRFNRRSESLIGRHQPTQQLHGCIPGIVLVLPTFLTFLVHGVDRSAERLLLSHVTASRAETMNAEVPGNVLINITHGNRMLPQVTDCAVKVRADQVQPLDRASEASEDCVVRVKHLPDVLFAVISGAATNSAACALS
jgi:hypothetical protein